MVTKVKEIKEEKESTLTFHSPEVTGLSKKRATIVGVINKTKTVMDIGVAVCSLQDPFDKKKGRTIATERAKKEKSRFISLDVKGRDIKQTFYGFAAKLSNIL